MKLNQWSKYISLNLLSLMGFVMFFLITYFNFSIVSNHVDKSLDGDDWTLALIWADLIFGYLIAFGIIIVLFILEFIIRKFKDFNITIKLPESLKKLYGILFVIGLILSLVPIVKIFV